MSSFIRELTEDVLSFAVTYVHADLICRSVRISDTFEDRLLNQVN